MALLRNHYKVKDSLLISDRDKTYDYPFPITHELVKPFPIENSFCISCQSEHEFMIVQYYLFQNGIYWHSESDVILRGHPIIAYRSGSKSFGVVNHRNGSRDLDIYEIKFSDYFRPFPNAAGILSAKRLGL